MKKRLRNNNRYRLGYKNAAAGDRFDVSNGVKVFRGILEHNVQILCLCSIAFDDRVFGTHILAKKYYPLKNDRIGFFSGLV